jgi:TonB family protein
MKTLRLSLLCAATCGILYVASATHATAAEDSRLRIIQTVDARFPPGLVMDRITSGQAWVMITVDAGGKLSDALVTRYTHEAFPAEALRVLRQWRYEPATVNGEPVAVRTELHFSFEASGAVISLDAASTVNSLMAFANKPIYLSKICPAHELDRPPVAVRTVSPVHPGQAPGTLSSEVKTVLDFIIDEKGTPRMPVLVSTSDAEFANRAVDALGQWQFAPPTRRGVPVAVRVQQAFVFPEGS